MTAPLRLPALAFAAALALLALPAPAWACEMCMGGAASGATVQGIGIAMLSLLCLTVVVWGGILYFFGNMTRRARLLAEGTTPPEDAAPGLHAPTPAEEMDALLDKVAAEGYGHLSFAERRRLRRLSDGPT